LSDRAADSGWRLADGNRNRIRIGIRSRISQRETLPLPTTLVPV